jgi:hypothetical protein
MFAKWFTPATTGKFQLPLGTYYLARVIRFLRPLLLRLASVESWFVRRKHKVEPDKEPLYITGIARAGTTITLEMLSQHPDVATHRYYHMPNAYLPYWWARFIQCLPLPDNPAVERIHQDGIMVTEESPEALDEVIWTSFMHHLHTEKKSNILDAGFQSRRFESFYRDHQWKLMVSQNRRRYVAKNNYAVSRLEYIHKIFPQARFLLVIRHPVHHIASLMKQSRLFEKMEVEDKRLLKMTKVIAHHEFGSHCICVNVDSTALLREVRALWACDKPVEGWAKYWASIYEHVADLLDKNTSLAERVLVLRYEDLCNKSEETLDKIIAHASLDKEAFAPVLEKYKDRLKPPTYYHLGFSAEEIAQIAQITAPTAARFGYEEAETEN